MRMLKIHKEADTPIDIMNPAQIMNRVRIKRIKSVLEAFEHIVELAKDSNLDDAYFRTASKYIKYASRKLALSQM